MISLPKESWSVGADKALDMDCPCCSKKIKMSIYKVGNDGCVFPSVCCADIGCSFLDYVVLEGWSEEEEDAS